MSQRVAHHMRRFGKRSETFVSDAIVAVQAHGWEGWVVTAELEQPPLPPVPPPERVLMGVAPSAAGRLLGRVRRLDAAQRRGRRLVAPVAQVAPRLIHAHFGWAGVDAMLAARQLGLPLVVSFHATDVTVYPNRGPDEARWTWQLYDQVAVGTSVSSFVDDALRRAGYAGPLVRVPAGVRMDQFPLTPPDRHDGEDRLVFVGRLVARKGLDVLLRALAEVRARRPGVVLTVVGEGEQLAELEALADALGLSGAVRWRGALPHAAVRQAMQDGDVVVMPSRTMPDGEAEGSPVVTKEALAIGRPVVATDSGGISETLPPALRGELVAYDDPDALAAQLLRVLEQADWSARIDLGRRWVEQEFDWDVLGGRLASTYEQALEEPRG